MCVGVCLSMCVTECLSVCVHDNSKNNVSIQLKLEHIVVYALSDQDQGHDFEIFLHLPQYKLLSPISQLWHMSGSCD